MFLAEIQSYQIVFVFHIDVGMQLDELFCHIFWLLDHIFHKNFTISCNLFWFTAIPKLFWSQFNLSNELLHMPTYGEEE